VVYGSEPLGSSLFGIEPLLDDGEVVVRARISASDRLAARRTLSISGVSVDIGVNYPHVEPLKSRLAQVTPHRCTVVADTSIV
jgi:hypothetical protein